MDPARDGWNLYAYTANNPIKFVDPDGHSASATALAGELVLGGSTSGSAAAGAAGSVAAPLLAAAVVGIALGGTAVVIIPGAEEALTVDGFSSVLANVVFNASEDGEVAREEAGQRQPAGQEIDNEELFDSKAPNQVTPGTTVVEGQHVNDQGRVEPWKANYDQFGRIRARTDYNAGNRSQDIPDTHHHTFE